MATYVPGTTTYMPRLQPFTPDYKFLSDIVDVKTNRYETNYKALNDIYGKVLHADLSRADTQEKRNQYTQDLGPKLEQVSGMDLSMVQNVDAARALFKPFYEDELIISDMVRTAKYRKQMGIAEQLKNSDNDEERQKYHQDGVQRLNYEMEDFINADPETALGMPMPKYVPHADIFEMSKEILQNAYGEGKGMELTQDFLENGWKVTRKNGDLLTNRVVGYQVGVDENGNQVKIPVTENIAAAFVQKSLLDDPRVLDSEFTRAYVESRNYAKNGYSQTPGSQPLYGDDAKRAWATDYINYATTANTRRINLAKQNQTTITAVNANWEEYKKRYGIVKETEVEKTFLRKIMALDAANVEVETAERIQTQTDNIDPQNQDLDGLLNDAYSIYVTGHIMKEITDASLLYAAGNSSMTMKIDEKWKMLTQENWKREAVSAKNNYDWEMAKQKQIWAQDNIILKSQVENAADEAAAKAAAEKFEELQDILDGVSLEDQGNITVPVNEDGDPDPNSPIIQKDQKRIKTELGSGGNVDQAKWKFIQQYFQEKIALTKGGDASKLTWDEGVYSITDQASAQAYSRAKSSDPDWGMKTMGWQQAKEYFMKPENSEKYSQLYNKAIDEFDNAYKISMNSNKQGADNNPLMVRSGKLSHLNGLRNNANGRELQILDGMFLKSQNDYNNNSLLAEIDIAGKDNIIKGLDENGGVHPYMSKFEQNLIEEVIGGNTSRYNHSTGEFIDLDVTDTKTFMNKVKILYAAEIDKVGLNKNGTLKDPKRSLDLSKTLMTSQEYKKLIDKMSATGYGNGIFYKTTYATHDATTNNGQRGYWSHEPEHHWNKDIDRASSSGSYGAMEKDIDRGSYSSRGSFAGIGGTWVPDGTRSNGGTYPIDDFNEVHSSYAKLMNRPYTSPFTAGKGEDGNDLGMPVYSINQHMDGKSQDEMTATGGVRFPVLTQHIDPLSLSAEDLKLLTYTAQVMTKMPDGQVWISSGSDKHSDAYKTAKSIEVADDVNAKEAVLTWMSEVIAAGTSGTKAETRPKGMIKYYSQYGEPTVAENYAAIQVRLPKKFMALDSKLITGDTPEISAQDMYVTIMFDKEIDQFPLGKRDYRFSQVERDIQLNETSYTNVPDGGNLSVWKEGDVFYSSFNNYVFNSKTGAIELGSGSGTINSPRPIMYPSKNQYIHTKDLDNYVAAWQDKVHDYVSNKLYPQQQQWKLDNPDKIVK